MNKTFATQVLKDVDLSVAKGEVHALLGGNGSGKSTLVKILAGVHRADPGGWIQIDGSRHSLDGWSSTKAKIAGLHFVHQDAAVFPQLTIAENLAIGRGFPTIGGVRIDRSEVNRRAATLLDRFHIDASPRTLVDRLRPAARTMVAIARALQDQEGAEGGILILDEPTASLPTSEVDILISALRRYAQRGQTIVFISHRLDEVLALADEVTVMRDGRRVATRPVDAVGESELVELIAGRPLDSVFPEPPQCRRAEIALSVRRLAVGPLRGVDLDVHVGEIVGVAGLLGSGRTELLRAVYGDLDHEEGDVRCGDSSRSPRSPREAMAAGMAFVPEDRGAEGIFGGMTVRSNLSAAVVAKYWRRGRLQRKRERSDAELLVDGYGIKPASASPPAGTLSGGNQQKVMLARWLRRQPLLLLLDEPTQGVDVGARSDIYANIRRAAEDGMGVLMVSSDFEELAHVCDRVLVLRDGLITNVLQAPGLSAQQLAEATLAFTEVSA